MGPALRKGQWGAGREKARQEKVVWVVGAGCKTGPPPLCTQNQPGRVRQFRAMGSKALGPHPAYFDSSRMVSSSPLSDSGYMRLLTSCWMMLMLWRYCHTPWGSGLIHANLGKACVRR